MSRADRRARSRLRSALLTLEFACRDCGSFRHRVEWAGDHWIVVVTHARSCPVLVNAWLRDANEEYLRGHARKHGYATSQYCEPDMIQHRSL